MDRTVILHTKCKVPYISVPISISVKRSGRAVGEVKVFGGVSSLQHGHLRMMDP